MFEFSEPWFVCDDSRFEDELCREMCAEHILFGVDVKIMASRLDLDDYLFALPDKRFAVVHLTWRQETDPTWPSTTIYESAAALQAALQRDVDERYAIPAADIGDTNLNEVARTNPAAAEEIARLRDLMNCGEESTQDFLRLCQLLFDVGSVADSEYLLRRNLEGYNGEALYRKLFGTAKQEEYEVAIAAFQSQFELELVFVEGNDFLAATFQTAGGPLRTDEYQLLSRQCEIEIGYIRPDQIEAKVTLLDPEHNVFDADEMLFLLFVNGVWELADGHDS